LALFKSLINAAASGLVFAGFKSGLAHGARTASYQAKPNYAAPEPLLETYTCIL
jgi:hypothetical protein